ncbi:MAG: HAD family hydrolase [Candidatus Omnitrophica bacterium]|nr:HAD family hydrolase [Candidatus Omnitrophota bacterium]
MKVIFLDRDGVINQYPGDTKYVTSWNEFKFVPGSLEALKKLSDAGFDIFVISNQAGVSEGIYPAENLKDITSRMLEEVTTNKAKIKEVFYCTHTAEENCDCRKPKAGLIKKALESVGAKNIDLKSTYFIGDSIRDVQTGKGLGFKTILVLSGKEKLENMNNWQEKPDYVTGNLKEAVEIVLK